MATYSYEYIPEVDTFAVFVSVIRNGEPFTRPIAEYFSEKSARNYVDKSNARVKDKSLPIVRCNAPIQYSFHLPDWWVARKGE